VIAVLLATVGVLIYMLGRCRHAETIRVVRHGRWHLKCQACGRVKLLNPDAKVAR